MLDIAAYRFDVSFRQISMQLSQMKKCERYANNVNDNPKSIEDIVAKRAVYQWAAGRIVAALCVRR